MANTYQIKVFTFDELSEDVQNEIAERECWNIMNHCMDSYGSDYESTLQLLEEATGFNVRDWQVDYCSCQFKVRYAYDYPLGDMDADEICGKYLFRYVNSIIDKFFEGKYYSLCNHYDANGKWRFINRHSRILKVSECPLSGMCYECAFNNKLLHYYYNWPTYPETYSLQDLMEDCFGEFFKQWHEEYEYWADNVEAQKEHIRNSSMYDDALYFEDGKVCDIDDEYLQRV